ncbi:hypothetical protein ACFVH6_03585 [Spirillospora sp. NPDC127200]
MSVVRAEARRRWLLVAALVAALCAVPVAIAAYPASAPGPDPQALRRLVLASADEPHEGLVETRGSLGLPALPGLDEATALLSGTSRLRVWYDGPQRWRVAQLLAAGERGFQQSAEALTVWDYEREVLTRVRGRPAVRLPNASDLAPPALARRLLGMAASADRVSALPARRAAGRTAVGLRVTPAGGTTTVGALEVWADPESGLPVEVRVTPRGGARPALTSRFLDLRLARPAASAVAPRPAPGLRTTTVSAPDLLSRLASGTQERLPDTLAGRRALPGTPSISSVRGYRDGLATFLVAPLPGRYGHRVHRAAADAGAPTVEMPGEGTEAVLLRTSLLTAIVVEDDANDRVFLLVGAVRPDPLTEVARELVS